jgi:tRNA uridine 5-carbamoylmethylation protein Kti12
MPTLYLMQGIPGSGKSFQARILSPGDQIVSADAYPGLYVDGVFDSRLLGEAHAACFLGTALLMAAKRSVIVDNTNLIVSEVTPYVMMALGFGYDVQIVRVKCSLRKALRRQTHGVPEETMKAMFRRFEGFKVPSYWMGARVRVIKGG